MKSVKVQSDFKNLLHWLGLRLGLARLEGLSVHDLLRHSLQRSLLLLLLLLKLHHHLLLLLLLLQL
jgi:hypothetical protein